MHQGQESGGIVVICNPAVARHLVVAIIALFDQHLELHRLHLQLDAEFGLPLRSCKDRHLLVVLAGVVGELELGARCHTGLSQQLLRLRNAFVHGPLGPIVGGHIGTGHPTHHHAIRRHLSIGSDFLRQNVTVNHHRKRLAHPNVLEYRVGVVQRVIAQAEHRRIADFFGVLRLVFVVGIGRQGVDPVVLARLVHLDVGVLLFDRQVRHLVQLHILVVPIIGTLGQNDLAVDLPVFKGERPIAHNVAGFGPFLAVFLDRSLVYRTQLQVGHYFRQEGSRERRLDFQRAAVQRLDTQLRVRLLAFDDVLGILQEDAVGRGVFGRRGRVYEPAHPVNEVFRGYGIAIRPFGILAQLEDPGLRVGLFPALGHARHNLAIGVHGGQPLEQITDHIVGGHARGVGRVQRFRLGAVIAHQLLFIMQFDASRQRGGQRKRAVGHAYTQGQGADIEFDLHKNSPDKKLKTYRALEHTNR